MVYLILMYILGVATSVIINLIFFKRTYGTLRIDCSNPEKDLYLIEINDLEQLTKRKRITLKVDNHADLSQK